MFGGSWVYNSPSSCFSSIVYCLRDRSRGGPLNEHRIQSTCLRCLLMSRGCGCKWHVVILGGKFSQNANFGWLVCVTTRFSTIPTYWTVVENAAHWQITQRNLTIGLILTFVHICTFLLRNHRFLESIPRRIPLISLLNIVQLIVFERFWTCI